MEQLKAFIKKAKTDSELAAKLDELGSQKAVDDEIITLAAEYGFTFTKEDIEQMQSEEPKHCGSCKLSEEELDKVAGGGGGHDRYNPDICSQYTDVHYYCVGFFSSHWCKYYERTLILRHQGRDVDYNDVYHHKCQKEYFDYEGKSRGGRF